MNGKIDKTAETKLREFAKEMLKYRQGELMSACADNRPPDVSYVRGVGGDLLTLINSMEVIEEPEDEDEDETVADGFGSEWPKRCPECKCDSMVVTRPGKAQCMNCG